MAGEMIDPLDRLMSGDEMTITEDINNVEDIGNYDFLYYVDEIIPETPRGARANLSKYVDNNGIPIPPKNYADLASRGDDPSVEMWMKAGDSEWTGLVGRKCFLHNQSKTDLVRRGVLPGKRLVGMRMLFDAKTKNGVFDRAKGRCVVQGHRGSIRPGIDFDSS
jgi:hypothetical protein